MNCRKILCMNNVYAIFSSNLGTHYTTYIIYIHIPISFSLLMHINDFTKEILGFKMKKIIDGVIIITFAIV